MDGHYRLRGVVVGGCIVTFNITGFGESRSHQKRYE